MDQCSWEPAENLNSCPELVEKFEKIQTGKLKKKSPRSTFLLIKDILEAEKKKRIRSLKNELNKSRGAFKKFIPEEIMNATNVTGELLFLMKWQNESSPSVVKASEANTKCPLVVIDFYEKRLHIVDSYE